MASPVAEPGKPGNRPTSGTPVPTPSTTTTSAAAQPSAGPPQGEPIIENYNGTATQGNKTLMSLNKSWKENRAEPIIEHYNGTATQGNKTYMSLNKSWKRSDGKAEWAQDFDVLCGPQFGMAADGPFWEGYTYLSQIKGAMHMEPGPRKCSRVSCSWDTAVKACNDVSLCLSVSLYSLPTTPPVVFLTFFLIYCVRSADEIVLGLGRMRRTFISRAGSPSRLP